MVDDASCTYAAENFDCDGNCIVELDCNGDCAGDLCGCNGETTCAGIVLAYQMVLRVDECGDVQVSLKVLVIVMVTY